MALHAHCFSSSCHLRGGHYPGRTVGPVAINNFFNVLTTLRSSFVILSDGQLGLPHHGDVRP
jgi:hypothetical protein